MFRKKTPKFTTSMSEAAAPAKSWRRCFLTAFKRTDACSVNWYFSASEATGSLGILLGPLIGYQLSPYCSRVFHVYGTLDDPVHALNLPDRISYIHSRHPEALLVAIDASLGSRRHQGYITIGNGAIRPGAGAGKTLPEVGDIFITGIVNVSGSFEQLLLQTTRLATIFHMAESISQGILLACRELEAAGTSELLL